MGHITGASSGFLRTVGIAAFMLVSVGIHVAVAQADTGPPTLVSAPPIGGVATVGGTLIAHPGTWEGTAPRVESYRWYHCPFPLPQPIYITPDWPTCRNVGAGSRYAPSPADAAGGSVVVRVTMTNAEGTSEAAATPGPISPTPLQPSSSSPPVISGGARTGETLEASEGLWASPLQLGYLFVWWRCQGNLCTAITGREPTGKYTPTVADIGSQIKVMVIAIQPNGEPPVVDSSSESAPTATVVSGAPGNAGAPVIDGVPKVGNTLTVSRGEWRGTTPLRFEYQWERCAEGIGFSTCTDVDGAVTPAYVVTPRDALYFLRARVRASNAAGDATAESAPTGPVFAIYGYAEAKALGYGVPSTPLELGLPVCDVAVGGGFATAAAADAATPTFSFALACAPDPAEETFIVRRGPGEEPSYADPCGQGSCVFINTLRTQSFNWAGTKAAIEVGDPDIPWFGTQNYNNENVMNAFAAMIYNPSSTDGTWLNAGWTKSSETAQQGIFVYTELFSVPGGVPVGFGPPNSPQSFWTYYGAEYRLTPGRYYWFGEQACDRGLQSCSYFYDGTQLRMLRNTDKLQCQTAPPGSHLCSSGVTLEVIWPTREPPYENAAAFGAGVNFHALEVRQTSGPEWRPWDSSVATLNPRVQPQCTPPMNTVVDQTWSEIRVGKRIGSC